MKKNYGNCFNCGEPLKVQWKIDLERDIRICNFCYKDLLDREGEIRYMLTGYKLNVYFDYKIPKFENRSEEYYEEDDE